MVVEGEVHTDFQWVTLSVDALKNESLVNQVAELARRGGSPHPLMYVLLTMGIYLHVVETALRMMNDER